MICPQCHTPNREGDRFCEQCGTPLDTSMAQPYGDQSDVAATLMAGSPAASVLVRVGGEGEQERYPLGTRVVIGRLDSCDIPIHDKSVSREHARLSRLRDGYVIEDLGSTNGTLVNGQRIEEATLLHAGDAVTVGAIDFRFELKGAAADAAPSAPPWPSELPGGEFPFPPPSEPPVEAPTLRDLPFMSPAFSELEQQPPEGHDAEAENSEQVDAMKAALDFIGEDAEAAAPSSLPTDEPPEPLPSDGEAFSAQVSGVSSGPAEATAGPVTPPVEESPGSELGAATVTPHPGTAPAGSDETLVHEAQTVAHRLTELISDLASQLQDSHNRHAQVQQELQGLQDVSRTQQSVKQALQNVPSRAISPEQLVSLREMVDALAANPRDVEVLMRVAQQSANLAAVVDAYTQLQQIVDRVTEAVGGPSQA